MAGSFNPFELLDPASLHCVLSKLCPKDLLHMSMVCKAWQQPCYDPRLWHHHCQELWAGKVYVPHAFRAEPNSLKAFSGSLADSKRTVISEEELVTFTWAFRFKISAGPFWRILIGDAPLHRWFHRDRTMTGPKEDPLWTLGEGQEYCWRFCKSKLGRAGQFVQVNRYPSLELSRGGDWGWHMQNIWVTFDACFGVGPNPGRGNEPERNPLSGTAPDMDAAFVEAVAAAVVAAATAVDADSSTGSTMEYLDEDDEDEELVMPSDDGEEDDSEEGQ